MKLRMHWLTAVAFIVVAIFLVLMFARGRSVGVRGLDRVFSGVTCIKCWVTSGVSSPVSNPKIPDYTFDLDDPKFDGIANVLRFATVLSTRNARSNEYHWTGRDLTNCIIIEACNDKSNYVILYLDNGFLVAGPGSGIEANCKIADHKSVTSTILRYMTQ